MSTPTLNQLRIRAERLRRARQNGRHTLRQWRALMAYCGHKCVNCGLSPVTKDHIKPIFMDGSSDSIENLQPLCRSCNSAWPAISGDLRPEGWREALVLSSVLPSNDAWYPSIMYG